MDPVAPSAMGEKSAALSGHGEQRDGRQRAGVMGLASGTVLAIANTKHGDLRHPRPQTIWSATSPALTARSRENLTGGHPPGQSCPTCKFFDSIYRQCTMTPCRPPP